MNAEPKKIKNKWLRRNTRTSNVFPYSVAWNTSRDMVINKKCNNNNNNNNNIKTDYGHWLGDQYD